MENQHPEALILVNDRPSAIGDDLYQWALDAEDMIRRLHTRVEELEKDRGNAKRLVSKIWNQHPEARGTIEEGTGAWLVFGQDVETSGVSAQRVTQSPTLKASSDWLMDGGLLYRLNDRGTNCDEINVTMAGGLRTEAARVERAEAILNMLTIQKAADHIGKPSWDSHQWPQIVQDSSGNWFGVRDGWTMRVAPTYKGDELWLLREDGEFLSRGECSHGWRTSLEQRPTTKPTPVELNLHDYYCKGCGRIGEIEELSAQDKAMLRKLGGKPKTAAAPVKVVIDFEPDAYLYVNGEHRGVKLEWLSDTDLSEGTVRQNLYTEQKARELLATATGRAAQVVDAAAASPVAPNWKWMTHPSHNNGYPIPVFVFIEQGVTYYRPFDTEATEFEWELRDDEWAESAAPQQQADARDAERYRFLRSRDLETVNNGGVFAGVTPDNIVLNGTDLDAEIDAAIAVAKGE